jgi:hypothetical protein
MSPSRPHGDSKLSRQMMKFFAPNAENVLDQEPSVAGPRDRVFSRARLGEKRLAGHEVSSIPEVFLDALTSEHHIRHVVLQYPPGPRIGIRTGGSARPAMTSVL